MGKPEGKRLLGRPRSRWSIILKWIDKKLDDEARIGLLRLRIRTVSTVIEFRVAFLD
jgi:hypothetical protein